MSRWYMNDEQKRGYDDRREEGRYGSYPHSEDYDYRRGWDERDREERRERDREEERRQEEEMEERRAYERSIERAMEEEEYYASMEQQQQEMLLSDNSDILSEGGEASACHWLDSSEQYERFRRCIGVEEIDLYYCRSDGSCPGHRQLRMPDGSLRTDPKSVSGKPISEGGEG